MAETKRSESSLEPAEDRDSRAEALLVEGLDSYFNGQYEDAIHIWTRVLFLDRAHARARAYIERARSALGERQRHAEEMLHVTGELLAKGHTAQARHALTEAMQTSTDDARTAELRWQLDRLEQVRPRARGEAAAAVAVVDAVPLRRRRWGRPAAAAACAIVVGGVVAVAWAPIAREMFGWDPAIQDLTAVAAAPSRPVLSSTDVALVRARTLYAQGRLSEALLFLDRVSADSASRPVADQLRVQIQQLLLATARRTSGSGERLQGRP